MEKCTYCGEEYSRLGQHWAYNPEHRPSLTIEQRETAKGLILGDGNVNHGANNSCIRANMINREFLDHLDQVFGVLSLGTDLLRTAEEEAARNRDRGFSEHADPDNYSDIYHWESRRHPEFDVFSEWYSSGKKEFPDDLELSPTSLSIWYSCDGCLTTDAGEGSCMIALNNESGNKDKILSIFEKSPVPSPDRWYEGETNTQIHWNVDSGLKMFSVMGDPVPGFEYKWTDRRV